MARKNARLTAGKPQFKTMEEAYAYWKDRKVAADGRWREFLTDIVRFIPPDKHVRFCLDVGKMLGRFDEKKPGGNESSTPATIKDCDLSKVGG